MMWLLTRLVVWPAKAGYNTGRLFGYRRLTVFLLGFVCGLLVAPMAGAELRAILKARLAPEGGEVGGWTPAEAPIDITTPTPF